MLFSLSHKATISYVGEIGRYHDADIFKWKECLEAKLAGDDLVYIVPFNVHNYNNYSVHKFSINFFQVYDPVTSHMPDTPPKEAFSSSNETDGRVSPSSSISTRSHVPTSSEEPTECETQSSEQPTSSHLTEELDNIFGPEMNAVPTSTSLMTYKIVGDNIDKNVKPPDMRSDHQTRSLHYFQAYAVRDRIDLSIYEDMPSLPDISSVNVDQLLPTEQDAKDLKKNCAFIAARVLKKYMPFFKKFGSGLERHIHHEFYTEMSSKSEVVSILHTVY